MLALRKTPANDEGARQSLAWSTDGSNTDDSSINGEGLPEE